MPSPEKIAFFEENKEVVADFIERENVRRGVKNHPPLTENEIDNSISEMMKLNERGNLHEFKFPDIKERPKPVLVKNTENYNGKAFRFDIVECVNGFLLKINNEETFIFKNRDELGWIFDKVLFKEAPCQERGPKGMGSQKLPSKKG